MRSYNYDHILSYTSKMSHIVMVKRMHCFDTFIEFSHQGVAIPLTCFGVRENNPVYISRLDYFPDHIKKIIEREMNVYATPYAFIICSITNISGILVIENLITDSGSIKIPVHEMRKEIYSLPY